MRTTTRTTRARLATTTAVLAGAGLVAVGAMPASAASASEPDSFTSAFTVQMAPDMVVDSEGQATGGDPDGSGTMDLRVNSDEGVICYDITTRGVEPPYESPAVTATHVHEAPAGQPGPPRIAFPNPEGDGDVRTSSGCLSIPMDTGVTGDDGQDTGAGFSLTELEADPAAFFGDTHTSTYVPGAVRGQLVRVPVGGADTGAGGVADGSTTAVVAAGAGLAAVGAAGVVLLRRRSDARAEG